MTDCIPYQSERSEYLVILAIMQGKLPASIGDASIPDFGNEVLAACWSPDPAKRPSMTWCSEVLTRRTTALFGTYCSADFKDIPSEYKAEGDGWEAVVNPDVPKIFDIELLSGLPDLGARLWVISIDSVSALLNHGCSCHHLQFSPEGPTIAAYNDEKIWLFDTTTAELWR